MAIYYTGTLDRTFHALGDHTRRGMLARLAKRGECSITELIQAFAVSQPTASRHVTVLERAGLVARRVDGRTHYLRLRTDRLKEATHWIETRRLLWQGATG